MEKNDQIFRSYRTRPALFPWAHTRRCLAQATRVAAPQSATPHFYDLRRRTFTPAEVQLIYNELGEP